jgi:hypothetical protein
MYAMFTCNELETNATDPEPEGNILVIIDLKNSLVRHDYK